MISISNEIEAVTIKESISETDYGVLEPRISRTATLDGGAVIASSGCSHADRTLLIYADNVSAKAEAALRRITAQAAIVTMANSEGVFTGAISRFSCKYGKLEFTFLIKDKLTPD